MKKKTAALAVGILAIVGIGSWFGLNLKGSSTETSSSALTRTVFARTGEITQSVIADGSIEAGRKYDVRAKAAGELAQVMVSEGDSVEGGQLIAKMDTEELEIKLSLAKDNLEIAKSKLLQTEANVAVQKQQSVSSVESARANLASAKARLADLEEGPAPQEIEQSRAALRSAEASYESAKLELVRTEELFRQGAVSRQQLESAQLKVATAEEQYKSAREKLDLLLAGPKADELEAARRSVAQAEAALETALTDAEKVDVKEEDIAIARSQVYQAERNVELAQIALDQAHFEALFEGTITYLPYKAGDYVPQGAILATVSDCDPVIVRAYVDEIDFSEVQTGQKAYVTVDAYPDTTFEGTVRTIAPEGRVRDGVVSFEVTVEIPNPDAMLKPGMTAEVEILTMYKNDALLVPTEGIIRQGGKTYVLLRKGGSEGDVYQEVKLGTTQGGYTEILEGLKQGDRIVVTIAAPATSSTSKQGTNSIIPTTMPGMGGGGGGGFGR